MAGGCRVENDVIEVTVALREEPNEFVKGCDLGGAGARQLLPHSRAFGLVRRYAHLVDDTAAVGIGGGLRIDIHGEEAGGTGDWPWRIGELYLQHFVEIRSRVSADDQNFLATIRKRERHCTGKSRLSDATLAGEEQMASRTLKQANCSV